MSIRHWGKVINALWGRALGPKKIRFELYHCCGNADAKVEPGIKRIDYVQNDRVRKQLQVKPIDEYVEIARIRWFEHVLHRSADHVTREAWGRPRERRGRGRPRTTWRQVANRDMAKRGLTVSDTGDRAVGRARISGQPRRCQRNAGARRRENGSQR